MEAPVTLRERNQLTLPDRVAERLGVAAGDRLIIAVDENEPGVARLMPVRRSYAGIAGDLYGATHEEVLGYLDTERASWEPGPGTASDGTRFLTFEEARRIHRHLTRERYGREPKWRWPKCDVCGRLIARMADHKVAHRSGEIDEKGISKRPEQKLRSERRVRKWRTTLDQKKARAGSR